MKKNIVIGAALFIISLTSSIAQEGATVTASVAKSFEKSFKGAANPKWSTCGGNQSTSLVQFRFMDKPWLAYFDKSGNLISSGRRIFIHEVPVLVQNGLYTTKERSEKKYGALSLGAVYEMITSGVTEYYIPLANNKIRLMIAVRTDGTVVIKSRKKINTVPKPADDVIARNQ